MGSVTRRYPNLNRGIVLLVTLLLPPATAAAVLHALSQERPALIAPQTIEVRPAQEQMIQAAEEQTDDESIEPIAEAAPLPLPGGGESDGVALRGSSDPIDATHTLAPAAPLSSLAPRAPPA